jgi:hypothetical protein
MTTARKKEGRAKPKDTARIVKAQKEFDAILEEIKPFIKKRRPLNTSTTGQWKVVSFE